MLLLGCVGEETESISGFCHPFVLVSDYLMMVFFSIANIYIVNTLTVLIPVGSKSRFIRFILHSEYFLAVMMA